MDTLLSQLDVPFTFKRRAGPLAGDLRPAWRIALVLLILFYSRSRKASLQKLHVMSWSARTEGNRKLLVRYMGGTVGKDELVPRIEPSLNRAIDFALGEGLVAIENAKNLSLSEKGLNAAREIDAAAGCLDLEKGFLRQVKSFASERNIEDLLNWGFTL